MKLPTRSTATFLRRRARGPLPGSLLLLLFFALALSSSRHDGPTFDEQGFLTRGLGYLRAENRIMRVGHPLGLNALNAAFLAADPSVRLPLDHPSWQEPSFHRPSELFLWEIGNDVERVIFLGRLPTIWLGMFLAAFVGRWAGQLSGRRAAGWLAMALLVLDPNILAHSRLATTDLGLAAAATVAGYTWQRFLRAPSWSRLLPAGVALGLLQNTKFTAGLFIPLFALVLLAAIPALRRRGRWRQLLLMLLAYPLVGLLTLWAAYGFAVGTLPPSLPLLPQLAGRTLPLAHHLEQLLDIGGRMLHSTPAFLLGDFSDSGWWYYFPVAFLLKTPLPTLLLIGGALALAAARLLRARPAPPALLDAAALLLPALGYFAFALTTSINLGYRHLLPVLPFLAVFSAAELWRPARALRLPRRAAPLAGALLAALLFIGALRIYPHYLAYFNLLAGGPDNGWRYLVDSNIDWGQDLQNLKPWLDEQGVDHVWLSYFGEGRPDYYGISYTGLDSWPPRLMDPAARPFYPADPAPGVYAISATNLQGVHFADRDRFLWFRQRPPRAKIGYSIFIYDVAARGRPAELALSGVQLDELAADDFALLRSNDVRPHWFDAGHSWLLPAGDDGPGAPSGPDRWLAVGLDAPLHPHWAPLLAAHYEQTGASEGYLLYRQTSAPPLPAAAAARFNRQESELSLLAWSDIPATLAPGDELWLELAWRQDGPPTPLASFVHVVDSGGAIVAQWDGLGAHWRGWRPGDVLRQLVPLPLPTGLAGGSYTVWTGLYDPANGERWQTGAADRLRLGQFQVMDGG